MDTRTHCALCGKRVNQARQSRNKPRVWRSNGRTYTAHATCANLRLRETRQATK